MTSHFKGVNVSYSTLTAPNELLLSKMINIKLLAPLVAFDLILCNQQCTSYRTYLVFCSVFICMFFFRFFFSLNLISNYLLKQKRLHQTWDTVYHSLMYMYTIYTVVYACLCTVSQNSRKNRDKKYIYSLSIQI